MKRVDDLSKPQINAWYAVLCGFPIEILNTVVVEIGMSEARFPDVGLLYARCKRQAQRRGLMEKPYSPHADVGDRPGIDEITAVAERLGLRVELEDKPAANKPEELREVRRERLEPLAINHDPPDYAPVPDRGSQLEALDRRIDFATDAELESNRPT